MGTVEITEINIKLLDEPDGQLLGYGSIAFDNEFAVKDLRIINGPDGLFVAMPSRRASAKCPNCGAKNHLAARFCNDCGARQKTRRADAVESKRKLYVDVAHPINAACREKIQKAVITAYIKEYERVKGKPSEAP